MRFFRKQYVQTPGKKPPLTPETAVAAAVDESHAHENTDSEIQEAVLHRVPSGAVMIWGGDLGANPIPSGWLLCNGASYLRTDYPDLFAAIATALNCWASKPP